MAVSGAPAKGDFKALLAWYEKAGGAASVLRWYHTVGYARHAGVSVDMHEPPAIDGDDIEYLPGVRTLIDGRAMTSDEISATQKLLVQMSEDARDALQGTSTLAVVISGREP